MNDDDSTSEYDGDAHWGDSGRIRPTIGVLLLLFFLASPELLPHSRATAHTPELQHTLQSYSTRSRVTAHTPELQHTLQSYSTHSRATAHTPELQHTLQSYNNVMPNALPLVVFCF